MCNLLKGLHQRYENNFSDVAPVFVFLTLNAFLIISKQDDMFKVMSCMCRCG